MNTNNYWEQYGKIQAAAQKQAVAIDESMTKPFLSFAELRKRGVAMYAVFLKDSEDMDNAVNAIMMNANYSPLYKTERATQVKAIYEESVSKLKQEFKQLVSATLVGKEAALNKLFSTTPTAEQLGLLQALQIRGDNLSEEEIVRIACDLADNYNAMKALQTIAKNVGCALTLPELYNADVLFERFQWVKDYLSDRCNDFGTPWGKMSPFGRVFFGSEWEDPNYNNFAVELFDNHNALRVQEARLNASPEDFSALTEDERATLSSMFGGLRSSKELEKAILNAVTEDGSVANLIAKHDVYKNFLPNTKS